MPYTATRRVPRITPQDLVDLEARFPGFATYFPVKPIATPEAASEAAVKVFHATASTAEVVTEVERVVEEADSFLVSFRVAGD